uniref:C2H2-type domain-containing protein n=1 Tax=Glossina brevipalpis TaxID=37001 RepID=A0A1A9WZE8_9MUSC
MDINSDESIENYDEIESSVVLLQKCGEIFYDTLADPEISVSFQCLFCRKTFMNLNAFVKHLQSEHYTPPQQAPIDEISPESDEEPEEKYDVEEVLSAAEDSISKCELEDTTSTAEYIIENEAEVGRDITTKEKLSPDGTEKCKLESKPLEVSQRRREYVCHHCQKIFKKKWNLQQHLPTHEGHEKPYKCEFCPASYACKQNLIVHVRRHKGEKPFTCHFCTSSFASTSERYAHERCHTGERPYVCEFCGMGHTTSSHLNNHRRSQHLDERNFVCDICNKRFSRRGQLRMHHTNIHTDMPRNHVCTICKSAFKGKTTLKAHLKIHKEKTYKCLECGKKFAQHSGLYSHRKTHKKQTDTLLTDMLQQESMRKYCE